MGGHRRRRTRDSPPAGSGRRDGVRRRREQHLRDRDVRHARVLRDRPRRAGLRHRRRGGAARVLRSEREVHLGAGRRSHGPALGRRRQSGRHLSRRSRRNEPGRLSAAGGACRRRSRATRRAACSPAPNRPGGCTDSTRAIGRSSLLDSGLTELAAIAAGPGRTSSTPPRSRTATTRRRAPAKRPPSPSPLPPPADARCLNILVVRRRQEVGRLSHRRRRHVGSDLGNERRHLRPGGERRRRRARRDRAGGPALSHRPQPARCCCSPASTPNRSRDLRRRRRGGDCRSRSRPPTRAASIAVGTAHQSPAIVHLAGARHEERRDCGDCIRWEGAGGVQLFTRSGNTEKPDDSWSDWVGPYTRAGGEAIKSPAARFLQWKAVLTQARRARAAAHVGDRRVSAAQHAPGRDVGHDLSAGRRVSAAVLERRRRDRRTRRRDRRRAAAARRSGADAADARPAHVPERPADDRVEGRRRRRRSSDVHAAVPPRRRVRRGATCERV